MNTICIIIKILLCRCALYQWVCELRPENIWIQSVKHKSDRLFKGYTSVHNYLGFASELGESIAAIPSSNEDTYNLAFAVKQIEESWKSISQKEGELKALEAQLNNKKAELDKQAVDNEHVEQLNKLGNDNLKSLKEDFYQTLCGYLEKSHCETDYIKAMGYRFWIDLITQILSLGNEIGKDKNAVIAQNACYLIGIYDTFSIYDKAYEAMIIMAINRGYWVCIKRNTISWAKEQFILFELREAIQQRIDDDSKHVDREDYKNRLKEIDEIVGWS